MSTSIIPYLLLPFVYGLAGPAHHHHHRIIAASESYLGGIPKCSFNCVVGFAATSFPSCDIDDLECQCLSESNSGFTLGEGVVRCAISYCLGESSGVLEGLYQICLGIPGAQPETHGTLSATVAASSNTPPPTAAASSTSRTPSTAHSHSSRRLTSHHTTHSKTLTTPAASTISPTTTSAAAASSTAPTTQSAANAAHAIPALNNAQIAGVVVSSIIIGGLVLGLLLCVFCAKRKRKKRDSDASFGLVGDTTDGPRTPRNNPARSPAPESRRPLTFMGMPANPKQKRWTLWRLAKRKYGDDPPLPSSAAEKYGPDTFGSHPYEVSPMSAKSYQTTSKLLPDKPSFNSRFPLPIAASFGAAPPVEGSHFPPLPVAAAASESPRGPRTDPPTRKPVRFGKDTGLRMITPTPPGSNSRPHQNSAAPGQSQADNRMNAVSARQAIERQPSDPFLDSAYGPDGLPVALQPQRSTTRDLPRLETMQERSMPVNDKALLPGLYPPGPYPLQALPKQVDRFNQSHVSPTPSPNAGANVVDPFAAIVPHTAPTNEPKFSKWAPIKPQNQGNARPLTHYTNGSDTSFEDEDATPGTGNQAVGTLTPVVESPVGAPVGQGKQYYYPPIPGTTASSKVLRVTEPTNDGSPKRVPPPRSEKRLSALQAQSSGLGSGTRSRELPMNTSTAANVIPLPPTKIPQPQKRSEQLQLPAERPPNQRSSSPKPSKTPPSPSSPNFSRPQRPEEYRAASSVTRYTPLDSCWSVAPPVARQQRVRQQEEMLWRQREERERLIEQRARDYEARQRNLTQRRSRGYGAQGYNYGYDGYAYPRASPRRAQAWPQDSQPMPRGPWRGREAPIGAQWRH